MRRLRDWLIRFLGGVTEDDHELECLEANVQAILRLTAMQYALRQIRSDLDTGVELAMHSETPQRTH